MPNFFARFTFLLIMAITFLCVIIVVIVLCFWSLAWHAAQTHLRTISPQVWQFFPHGFTFGFLYHSHGSSLKGQSKFHLAMNCFY